MARHPQGHLAIAHAPATLTICRSVIVAGRSKTSSPEEQSRGTHLCDDLTSSGMAVPHTSRSREVHDLQRLIAPLALAPSPAQAG